MNSAIWLSVIIVNWNSGELLSRCLSSLRVSDIPVEIIIVDNCSTDNSVNSLKGTHDIRIIQNKANLGFGAACNIGVKHSSGEFILLLNPDTGLKPDTLRNCLHYFESSSDIEILGIKQLNSSNKVQRACSRLPDLKSAFNAFSGLTAISRQKFPAYKMIEWDHMESAYVDHVIGSFMLMRKELYTSLEGMDEDYFLYYEDIDFSARVKRSGGKVFYWAEESIFHQGGGTSANIKAKRLFYSFRSRMIYMSKHLSKRDAFLIKATILFIEPGSRFIMALLKFNIKGIVELFHAHFLLVLWITGLKTKKK